jgi:hypothetical protein
MLQRANSQFCTRRHKECHEKMQYAGKNKTEKIGTKQKKYRFLTSEICHKNTFPASSASCKASQPSTS